MTIPITIRLSVQDYKGGGQHRAATAEVWSRRQERTKKAKEETTPHAETIFWFYVLYDKHTEKLLSHEFLNIGKVVARGTQTNQGLWPIWLKPYE